MLRWLSAGILTIAATSPMHAQVRGATPGFAVSFGSGHGAGFAGRSNGFGHGVGRSSVLGVPYFFGDGLYTAAPSEPASPQVVFLQAVPPPPAVEEPKPQPLMIELQGDRYVRVGETPKPNDAGVAVLQTRPAQIASQPLPPAVLVYRDGHEEQVRDYTIANGVLYARGNYWSDGYWNKKIPLRSLNVPASLQASEKNGVRFVLPSSPNEVVTRP
jgi:hypothetical protein